MARFRVLSSISIPGSAPHGLAFDGENLWMSDSQERRVYKLSPTDGHVLLTIPFDGDVAGTAWDGQHLWQADNRSKTIMQIDAETGNVVLALACDTGGGLLGGLCHDGTDLWLSVTGASQLRRIRPTDGAIIKTHAVRKNVLGVGFDGRRLWYSETDSNRLRKVDGPTGTELMSYEVTGQPTGIALVGDGFYYCDAANLKIHKAQILR